MKREDVRVTAGEHAQPRSASTIRESVATTPREREAARRDWITPAAALVVLVVGGLVLVGVPIYTIAYLGLAIACVGTHLFMGHGGQGVDRGHASPARHDGDGDCSSNARSGEPDQAG